MDGPEDRRSTYLTIMVILVVLGTILFTAQMAEAQRGPRQTTVSPGGLFPIEPIHNETLYNNTPLIQVGLNESQGPYKAGSLVFLFDRRPVQSLEDDFRFTGQEMAYQVSSLFRLQPGQHNVTVRIETDEGELHELRYSIHYDPNPPREGGSGVVFQSVLIIVATLGGLGLLGIASFIVYLTQVKGWSWRKFAIRLHIPREVFTLYLPVGGAVFAVIAALLLREPLGLTFRFATEYTLLTAVALASFPYALDVHYKRLRRRAYERAYAQFLFEMADSMRGGIDPMKALIELAKTETGLLREALRSAADGLRLGRPFETVLVNMALPMKSSVVDRYARLVGEAAKVGGEISNVVYRAAKDMDSMVKIEGERIRAMKAPVMTIYIAFGVLLMMVNTLMDFGPQLTDLDIRALTSGQLASGGTADASAGSSSRLTIGQMETRFFHLLMITSIGTGLLIGSFSDGKLRYGLIHMLVMIVIGGAFYPFFVL